MTEFARPRLADQPWFSDLLEMHGFRRSATDAFTNGRATLRLTGSVIQAMPGDGSRAWRTDIGEASPETVRQLLATVLAAPAFLAQADLDRRSARRQGTDLAESPEAGARHAPPVAAPALGRSRRRSGLLGRTAQRGCPGTQPARTARQRRSMPGTAQNMVSTTVASNPTNPALAVARLANSQFSKLPETHSATI